MYTSMTHTMCIIKIPIQNAKKKIIYAVFKYTCKKFVHRVSEMLDKHFFQLNYLIEIKLIFKIRFHE